MKDQLIEKKLPKTDHDIGDLYEGTQPKVDPETEKKDENLNESFTEEEYKAFKESVLQESSEPKKED